MCGNRFVDIMYFLMISITVRTPICVYKHVSQFHPLRRLCPQVLLPRERGKVLDSPLQKDKLF